MGTGWIDMLWESTIRDRLTASGLAKLTILIVISFPALAAEWPAVSKEELAMADDPANPGAAAILLYREVSQDDIKALSTEYRRIKVLTDAGKKYADIEIPYADRAAQVEDIRARTIRPDGTVVNFQGQIFDRTAVRVRNTKIQIKAFTLPEVQRGSILEYSYAVRFKQKVPDFLKRPQEYSFTRPVTFPSAEWLVQEDLFTRRARFSLRPLAVGKLCWYVKHLPTGAAPQVKPDGSWVLEVGDLPAFQAEEHILPEQWLKSRVTFFYLLGNEVNVTVDAFWGPLRIEQAEELAPIFGEPKRFEKMVAEIVSPGDTPEAKLRKLYARVQQIRYLSYEPERTGQEAKRENLKENKNAEDVLKHGYGRANEINLALVALVRAAGFEAALMRLESRVRGVFESELLNPGQLDALVVWVRAGGKQYFLDPATRYCPFDLLPWDEAGATGIVLSQGPGPGTALVTTPNPSSKQAITQRKAVLELDAGGDLEGTFTVSFGGQEALQRRLKALNLDLTARKKMLEDEVKTWLPSAATADLQGSANWEQPEEALRAGFALKVPGYATSTGRRLFFSGSLFQNAPRPFQSAKRAYGIYFHYPFEELDDITWKFPPGYATASFTEKKAVPTQFGDYELAADQASGTLHWKRHLSVRMVYAPTEYYNAIRSFFNLIRSGDESQIVLERPAAAEAKEN